MLNQPPVERRAARPVRTAPTGKQQRVISMSDEQESAGFMAFLGEHQQFAASHRGA